jgi:hypothetical protein
MVSSQTKNDIGEPIKSDVCPACMSIADGTAAGWNGPLGDDVGCELPRGHEGLHRYVIEWADEERSWGWRERIGV